MVVCLFSVAQEALHRVRRRLLPIHPITPGTQTLVLVYNIILELLVLAVVIRVVHEAIVTGYSRPYRLSFPLAE